MDREVKEQYQVLIQAKDMGGQLGGLAGTTTVNITLSDVNDNPPRFSKSKSSVWSEKKNKKPWTSGQGRHLQIPVSNFMFMSLCFHDKQK